MRPDRRRRWTWYAVFVVATIVAYSSAIRAPFEFDDLPAIRQNVTIRQLLPPSAPLSPPANTPVAGRPVVNLSLALNFALDETLGVDRDGPNATTSYHVVNVLFHLLTGFLLFGVIRRTLARVARPDGVLDAEQVAGFTVLLWLVHPIQTEALDYVIQRTELIVSTCYAATLYAAVRAWDAQASSTRRRWYVLAVLSCALGMASKEVMVTAPLMVLLYDRAFRSDSFGAIARDRGRRTFHGALFASMAIVIAFIATNVRSQSVGFGLGITWYQYLYTQAWAVTRYLRLIAWPSGLTFDYGESPIRDARGIPGLILLGTCAWVTILAWTRRKWLWLGFLGAWFFIILSPSSSVIPIRTEIAAERRVYLASVAIILLIVLGVARLRRRAMFGLTTERIALAAVAAVLVVVTFARGLTYATPESLFRDVVDKAPNNPRGHAEVGLALFLSGPARFADAEDHFRKAIALDSTYFPAWHTLGTLQLVRGHWSEARDTYERALRVRPDNPDALAGMARALVQLHRADEAIPLADRLGPRDRELLWSLGKLLVEQGRGALALKYLEAAASGEPPALGLALLSMAYAQSNRVDDATRAAALATATAGDTAGVYLLAGRAMLRAHRVGEARTYLQQALALDPSSTVAKLALDSAMRATEP